VNSSRGAFAVVAFALLAAGSGLNHLRPAASESRAALKLPDSESGTVRALDAFAAAAGFRALAADLVWIALQGAWERRDAASCEQLVRTATELDPGSLFFWRNGVRLIAFDLPLWRIAPDAGGQTQVPEDRQRQIRREHAAVALGMLDRGLAAQPSSAALWLERAAIELHGAGDPASAAASYRRAWELDPSVTYAARVAAQLLWHLGRFNEARSEWQCLQAYLVEAGRESEAIGVQARLAGISRDFPEEKATHESVEQVPSPTFR
jgi:tetratricopeptide (TPR) repeat protein